MSPQSSKSTISSPEQSQFEVEALEPRVLLSASPAAPPIAQLAKLPGTGPNTNVVAFLPDIPRPLASVSNSQLPDITSGITSGFQAPVLSSSNSTTTPTTRHLGLQDASTPAVQITVANSQVTFVGSNGAPALYLRANLGLLEFSLTGQPGSFSSNLSPGSSKPVTLAINSATNITVKLGAGGGSLHLDSTLVTLLTGTGGSLQFDGGPALGKLYGPSIDSIWTVSGAGSGVVGPVTFSNVGSLVGGVNNKDTFIIGPSGYISGLIDGGAGGYDVLELQGPSGQVVYHATGGGNGTILRDGQLLQFAGMEPIEFTQAAGTFTYQGTSQDDTISLHTVAGVPGATMEITGTSGGVPLESVQFATPSTALNIEGGAGNDSITVNSVAADFKANLGIYGDSAATQNTPGAIPDTATDQVTFAGNIALHGGSLNVVAQTITVNPGVTISTLPGLGNLSAPQSGDITLWARQLGTAELEAANPSPGIADTKTASISVGSGSGIFGGEVFLLSYAEDNTFSANSGSSFFTNLAVTQLAKQLGTNLQLPFKALVKDSTASVTLGTNSTISADGTLGIFVNAKADASGSASSELFSLGYSSATVSATVDVGAGARLSAGNSVNINADGSATADMETDTSRDLGQVPQDPSQTALSFAVSVADVTSHATLAPTAVITAGLTANFRATGEIDSKAAATSGEYSDGTAALAGSVQISNSDIQTTVGGNITANLRGKQAPAAGVVTLEFDPTAAAGQLGYIDPVANTIRVGPNALVTGDAVTYNSASGTPIGGISTGGLVSGNTYYVITSPTDPNVIQLAKSELAAYRGTAVPLSGIGFGTATLNSKTFAGTSVDSTAHTIALANPPFSGDNATDASLLGKSFALGQAVVYHQTAGQPAINGLVDGQTYYVIADTGEFNLQGNSSFLGQEVIQLARSVDQAKAGVAIPITVGSSGGTGYTLSALHVLDSGLTTGLGVASTLDSTDKATAEGGLETASQPTGTFGKLKQSLTDLYKKTQEPLLNLLFNNLTSKYYSPASGSGNSGASSTLPVGVAGSFAFSYANHQVNTDILPSATLKSNGDLEVQSGITEATQVQGSSTTDPKPDGNGMRKANVSVAVTVDIVSNTAHTTIESGARLDALQTVRIVGSNTYPFLTQPDGYIPTSIAELAAALKSNPLFIKDYLNSNLGLKDKLFNTWTNSLATADQVGVAGSINVVTINNDAQAVVKSGALINQNVAWRGLGNQNPNNTGAQTVTVEATNALEMVNLTGVFDFDLAKALVTPDPKVTDKSTEGSSNSRGGFGGVIFLMFLTNTTKAIVEPSVSIYAGPQGGFNIKAMEDLALINLAQSGAVAGQLAVAGTFSYLQQKSDTEALLDRGAAVVSPTATVYAGSLETTAGWSGGVAKGQAVGVGASVAINDVTRNTLATVGDSPAGGSVVAGSSQLHVDQGVTVKALNDGSLTSLAVAGSRVSNQAQNSSTTTSDPLDGESLPILFGDQQPQQQQSMPAKTGVSVAGAVSVNLVSDTTQASTEGSASISADSLAISASNDSAIYSGTGGLAIANPKGSQNAVGLAGAFSFNQINDSTQANLSNASVALNGPDNALSVTAAGNESIYALAAGASGTLAGGGSQSPGSSGSSGGGGNTAFSLAGSVSINRVTSTTSAFLNQDSLLLASGGTSVAATDTSDILAIAGSLSLAIVKPSSSGSSGSGTALSFGVAAAVNHISDTSQAYLDGVVAQLKGAGGVSVQAASTDTINAFTVGGAASAVTGNSNGGIAGAGAGSGSVNDVDAEITATLRNGTSITAATGAVTVNASNNSTIVADGGGVALAIAKPNQGNADAFAVGASFAVNQLTGTATADVDHSTVATAGKVAVTALLAPMISAVTLAGSASAALGQGKGLSISGAGAGSGNQIGATARARVRNGSQITTGDGGLQVDAEDDSSIHATAGSAALALALSKSSQVSVAVGASMAISSVANTVDARIENSQVTGTGAVSVTAKSTATIDTWTIGLSGSISKSQGNGLSLAGAGSGSGNDVNDTVEAVIESSSVQTPAAVSDTASDIASISAESGAGALGVTLSQGSSVTPTVGISVTANHIGDTVLAQVDQSQVGTVNSPVSGLTVAASDQSTITTNSVAATATLNISTNTAVAIAGAGGVALNNVANTVTATISGGSAIEVAAGGLSVTTSDSSNIQAVAAGGALSVGVSSGGTAVSVAIGAAVAINQISNSLTASIVGSTVAEPASATGKVQVGVTDSATINSKAIAATVSVAAGNNGVAFAGGGAYASNTILNQSNAFASNSELTAGGGVSVTASSSDSIEALVLNIAASVGVGSGNGGAVSLGASIARNQVGYSTDGNRVGDAVQAYLANTDVKAAGALTVQATSTESIQALTIAASVAIAATGENALGLSGSGVDTENRTGLDVGAYIDAVGQHPVSAASVAVTASDSSTITANSAAASLAGSFSGTNAGAVSVGVDLARNVIDNDVQAYLLNLSAGLSTTSGGVDLEATSTDQINATSVAASLAAAASGELAGGISGAGADSTNVILGKTNAFIDTASGQAAGSLKSAGAVTLKASNSSSISATVIAASVGIGVGGEAGVGVSIGAAIAHNFIGRREDGTAAPSEVEAYIQNTGVATSGQLSATALGSETINATVVAGSAAVSGGSSAGIGLSGAGVSVDNEVEVDIKSFINGDGGTGITVGNLVLTATDQSTVTALAGAASLAASFAGEVGVSASIGVSLAKNSINDDVEAYVSNTPIGLTTTVGGIDVEAKTTATIDASSFAASVAVGAAGTFGAGISGAGAEATNIILGATNAYLAGPTGGAQSQVTSAGAVTVAASNSASIHAIVPAISAAVGVGGEAGAGIAVGVAVARNLIGWNPDTTQSATYTTADKPTIINPGDTVKLTSGPRAGDIYEYVGSVPIVLGKKSLGDLDYASTDASTNKPLWQQTNLQMTGSQVQAFVRNAHVTAPGQVQLKASSSEDINATVVAAAVAIGGGGTVGVGLSGAGVNTENRVDVAVKAFGDQGSRVVAGSVDIEASDTSGITALSGAAALSAGVGGTVGVSGSIGVALALNEVDSQIDAYLDSSSVQSGPVQLKSTSNDTINATTFAAAVALGGGGTVGIALSGAGADATNVILGETNAYANASSITTTGSLSLDAENTSGISATVGGAAASLAAGTVSGSAAVGAALARNLVGWEPDGTRKASLIEAYLTDTSVTAGGSLAETANANETITAEVFAGAVAIAAGATGSLGLSGSGVSVENRIGDTVEAVISGSGSTGIQVASATLTATDESQITANAQSVALALAVDGTAGGAISVGVNLALNEISNDVEAGISRAASFTATAGDVSVTSAESAVIHSTAVAASAAVGVGIEGGGVGLSGAGAEATNAILTKTNAYASTSAINVQSGRLDIEAHNTSEIHSEVDSLSAAVGGGLFVGVAFSVGASIANNEIGFDSNGNPQTAEVRAFVQDSSVTASQDLAVHATDSAQIDAKVAAGSGAVAAGAVGIAAAGAGIGTDNKSAMAVEAFVDGAGATGIQASSVAVTASDTSTITVDSESVAISASFAVAGFSVAVSGVKATNEIQNDVEANIQNASNGVTSTVGDVEVTATETAYISATTASVSASISAGISAAGAGVGANNTIADTVHAGIGASSSVTSATGITISATDTPTSSSEISTAAVSVGVVSLSIGVVSTSATISDAVTASVSNASVTATSGDISVTTNLQPTIVQTTALASLALGYGGAVSGLDSNVMITATAEASANSASLTAVGHKVEITSTGFSSLSPESTGAAVGLISVAAVSSEATIAGSTLADIQGRTTVNAGTLDVKADDTNISTPSTLVVGVGAVTGAGASSTADVKRSTKAYVGVGADLEAGTGAVNIMAHSMSTTHGKTEGGSVGAISVTALSVHATDETTTQAFVDDGVTLKSGGLTVNAKADDDVSAPTDALGIGFFGTAAVIDLKAVDTGLVEAYVGPSHGKASAGTPTVVTVDGGDVAVSATGNSSVQAKTGALSISLLGALAATNADAEASPTVRAYLGQQAQIVAPRGKVTFDAAAERVSAVADGFAVAAALGIGVTNTGVTAKVDPNVLATVDSGSSIDAGSVAVNARVDTDSAGNPETFAYNGDAVAPAYAKMTLGSGAVGAAITVGSGVADNAPTLEAGLASGAAVTAAGAVSVMSNSLQSAQTKGLSVAVAESIAGAISDLKSTSAGSDTTYSYGTVNADSLNVQAVVSTSTSGNAETVGAAVLGGYSGPRLTTTTTTSVTTTLGGIVNTGGDVFEKSDVTSSSGLTGFGIAAAGVAAVGIASVSATDSPILTTQVADGATVTSRSGNVTIQSLHNSPDRTGAPISSPDSTALGAHAEVKSISAALLVAVDTANVTATADSNVQTNVAATANLRALGGTVTVEADSDNLAAAKFTSASGGIVRVSTGNPTSEADGSTTVNMLGSVKADDGSAGASALIVSSNGYAVSSTQLNNAGGGLVSVSSTSANANSRPTTMTQIGSSGNIDRTIGNTTIEANGYSAANSASSSVSGGLVRVDTFSSNSTTTPRIGVQVAPGSNIQAGGTITVQANHNHSSTPVSDGSFNASASPSGGVDAVNNTITFALPPGVQPGNVVTYDDQGGLKIGGLTQGGQYGVLKVVGNSVTLGASISKIDPATDTLSFSAPHNLQTGQTVIYSVDAGGTPAGGLTPGAKYTVNVIDSSTVKLLPLGTSPISVTVSGANVAANTINIPNSFHNGDLVTYRTPAPLTFSSGDGSTSGDINIAVDGSGIPKTSNNKPVYTDDNTIFLGSLTTDSSGNVISDIGHGLSTGDAVMYTPPDASHSIVAGGAGIYYVIRVDQNRIKLADSYAHAVGVPAGSNNNPPAIPVTPLTLNASVGSGRQQLSLVSLSGLVAAGNVQFDPITGASTSASGNYYVVNATAGSFQLASTQGGAPIAVNNSIQHGGANTFATEGVAITSTGSGAQGLVIPLVSAGLGTQKLTPATGGPSSGASLGNWIANASGSGSGGGFVNVANAHANSNVSPTVTNDIGSGALLTGGNILVTSDNEGGASASSSNNGGGFVSVGTGDANSSVVSQTTTTVHQGAVLTADGNVEVDSNAGLNSSADSEVGGGGFVAIGHANAGTTQTHTTLTIVDGVLNAGASAIVQSVARLSGSAYANCPAAGFGSGANASATVTETANSLTQTEVQGDARITGTHVVVTATVASTYFRATTDATAGGFGARSEADSTTDLEGTTRVLLDPIIGCGVQLDGTSDITLNSIYNSIDLFSSTDSACHAFAGEAHANSTITDNASARIDGEPQSVLKTADLSVNANQIINQFDRNRNPHGGFLVGHYSGGDSNFNPQRLIYWESTVILLGAANPELVVDSTGKITKLSNVVVLDDQGNAYHLGDTLPAGAKIEVQNLQFSSNGAANFNANHLDNAPDGQIWGNAGRFIIQDTWDSVLIQNSSDRDLVTHGIDVVNSNSSAVITVAVDHVPGPVSSPSNGVSLGNPGATSGSTFEFDLRHSFVSTLLQILNLQPGGVVSSAVVLAGGIGSSGATINNPIGTTQITNERGSVVVDPSFGLLRTNTLEINAEATTLVPNGVTPGVASIGAHTVVNDQITARTPLPIELVQYADDPNNGAYLVCPGSAPAPTVHPVKLNVEAATDAVLDVTVVDRENQSPRPLAVTLDSIRAGNDADVLIHDSVRELAVGSLGAVEVRLVSPANPTEDGFFNSHFRPDTTGQATELGALGSGRTAIDSNYTVTEIRAGNNITVEHPSTATKINLTVHSDVDATLTALHAPADPNAVTQLSTSDNVGKIDLGTNGSIIDSELVGDLRVGTIASTAGDVTLSTTTNGASIFDVLGTDDDVARVIGNNITLTASTGAIGSRDNYLEIDSAHSAPGVLIATAQGSIFLEETAGSLSLASVISTQQDVSLYTLTGAILDANPGSIATVQGRSIDLFAQGGSIGVASADGSTDLKIRTNLPTSIGKLPGRLYAYAVGTPDDGVYITETIGGLWILRAESADSNVRLTIPGTTTAQSGNLTLLGPGATLDGYTTMSLGTIAAAGEVRLLVGGNVDTDVQSIITGATVFIFGDYQNLVPGVGTVMHFRGEVTGHSTQIFGNVNDDSFYFDQTKLGGQTYVYGSNSATTTAAGDGNDYFEVSQLQTMDTFHVDTKPDALQGQQVRDTLQLDGQQGSDTYVVNTAGSLVAAPRDYIINVLDTGAKDNGSNTLIVNGSADPDVFLLRQMTFIPDANSTTPAFVALLHGTIQDALNQVRQDVERINYDENINGRLVVNGGAGNDYFAVDGNSALTTLDGGAGDDTFQIGQLYKGQRQVPQVSGQDVFPTMLTTKGWLSDGADFALVAIGGSGNDQFHVYSNQAEVRLEGDDGNDYFEVRAFVQADPTTGQPIPTSVKNQFLYTINAPVTVDGGTGNNALVVFGTECDDNFVITNDGIFGAGLHVNTPSIQSIIVDGREGNNHFYTLGVRSGVSLQIFGGVGFSTMKVGGPISDPIISRDLEGFSLTEDASVASADAMFNQKLSDGVAVHVATQDNGQVVIQENGNSTVVSENGETTASYTVSLAAAPSATVFVDLSAAGAPSEAAALGAKSILISLDGGVTWGSAGVLKFDVGQTSPQTVLVKAVHDFVAEGERWVAISATTRSDDARFNHVAVRNVNVDVIDADQPGLVVHLNSPNPTVVEGNPPNGVTDSYTLALAQAPMPGTQVTVTLSSQDQRIGFGSADSRFNAANETVTFDSTNWMNPVTIVISAANNGLAWYRSIAEIRNVVGGTDPAYNSYFASVPDVLIPVTVVDANTGGTVVQQPVGDPVLVAGQPGTVDYSVRLSSQPTAPVKLTFGPDNSVLNNAASVKGNASPLSAPVSHGLVSLASFNPTSLTVPVGPASPSKPNTPVQVLPISASPSLRVALHAPIVNLSQGPRFFPLGVPANPPLSVASAVAGDTRFDAGTQVLTFGAADWNQPFVASISVNPNANLGDISQPHKLFPLQSFVANPIQGLLAFDCHFSPIDYTPAQPLMLPPETNLGH